MLPYLIAGAIGFGIGKLFENGGETFMAGGRITTNEGIIESFLNSNREVRVGNLESVEIDDIMYLRNYRTFIAKRMGDKVKISSQKYSQTTSRITNRLKALAQQMGYSVEYVTEKEIYNFDKFVGGGEVYALVDKFDENRQDYDQLYFKTENYDEIIGYIADLKNEGEYDSDMQLIEVSLNGKMRKFDSSMLSNGGETFMAGGRITKYVQLYFVQGNYGQGWEDLTAHDNRKDARAEMRVYDDNESYPHRVIQRRVLRTDYEKGNYANGGGVEYRIGGEVDKELTIEQTRKIAQETANILGTEFSVTKNSVDVASFDLDLNGEEFEGGSYLIMKNGDVLNVALPNNPVYYNYKERSKNPKMIRTIFEEEYFENFDNGGGTFMAGGMTNEDIIFEYPKDSNGRIMSWINVGTGNMEIASKTGTVGQVRDGHQLIILKSETPNKVDYHILVDYLPEENKINMVRGKFNSEPSPKYQSYINDLFRMLKISQTTRDYQDEDIANQVYVKRYLINNFGNPPKGCQIKATELGVEIHFDSTNKMSSDWAMKIGDKYGYPNGNFEMRYSSGNVPITYVDTSKIAKNTSKSEKGYFNFGETFMAGGIGESDDKYGGQINKIVTELKGMKGGLNNKAPYVFVKEGYIYVSAENGDNYADYYEYTIDEKLEDLADRYNTYWDWETAGSIVLAPIDTYAGGGLAKKRRRSASVQYGRSDTEVDKTRPAKPVGYRFTDEKATELNKETYDIPTESQVKKYLGKGIYKENRKNRSDKDRDAKL